MRLFLTRLLVGLATVGVPLLALIHWLGLAVILLGLMELGLGALLLLFFLGVYALGCYVESEIYHRRVTRR